MTYLDDFDLDVRAPSAKTDPWWSRKTYAERQAVMDRQATQREVDRIQSNRAPATWWSSLSLVRKHQVYEAEMQ